MATFVRVAERGSFTRAADDLGISRAQASQQVAALEKRLGVRLFDRTTRKVALSNDGAEYLERSRRILAELAQADEAISRTRERPQGRLRVDVPVAFGQHLLYRDFSSRASVISLHLLRVNHDGADLH